MSRLIDASSEGDAQAAARYIINNLDKNDKVNDLANAMQAYAYLLQEVGVKVVVE